MQQNLVLIFYTLIAIVVLWFLTMTVSRNLFLHSDSDLSISGTVAINDTDIGNQCGDDYTNSSEPVEYKLNNEGKIVYLCPQGLWPIQSKVVAATLTDQFRNSLSPAAQAKLLQLYPPQPTQPATNPFLAAPTAGTGTQQ